MMCTYRAAVRGAVLLASTCFSLPVLAESTDTSFSVGSDIIVTARGMAGSSANVITSVDRLGGDVAQNANVDYVWELIGRLPGVLITDFNQGTTSGKFSFRGFNGEGEVNAAKLLIDGIPSNSNDGNMPFIDMVFPLDIASVEVVRGTSDPRYGVHNIAGNANIMTRIGGNYLDVKATVGSNATYDGQLTAGYETGGLSQNYQVAYRNSGGYRQHGDLDRLSLAGKWFYGLSDTVRLGAIARYYRGNADEPGYLTRNVAYTTPRATNAYNVTDGDKRRMQQYSVHLDIGSGDQFDWSTKAYFNRLRDDRYVKFSAGASQQRRVTHEDQWGALTAAHYHMQLGGMHLMLEGGADIQKQDNESLRFLSVGRVPTSQTRDQQFDLTIGGVYAQAVLEPTGWLKITPAYRIDWVGGDFANRLNNTTAPINDYGSIDQPKISVAVTPTDAVTLYGNWGKTFQIGLGSGAYLIPPRQVDLAPSINTGWEAGIKYAPTDRFDVRVAYWKQSASGEIKRKLNDPLGDFENVGATRRQGIDVQASARPVRGLAFWGAVAWQKAVITRPDPASPQLKGNDIDHTPRWLWSGGVDVTPIRDIRLSLWGNGQSSYELTTANNRGRFGNYAIVNAEIVWTATEQVELSLSAKNLFNEYYEYVWWDGAQSLHSPADSRNISVSARARF
jgi:iron complex outermembrane receptor protein